jgi:hypothetical protein
MAVTDARRTSSARLALLARRRAEVGPDLVRQILDVLRLWPADNVTATQVRRVVEDFFDMGNWKAGERDILIVFDADYDAPRMAYLLEALPVQVLGRMRTDRVMQARPGPLDLTAESGRPPKHGKEFRFATPDTCGRARCRNNAGDRLYGTARAMAGTASSVL